MSKETKEDVKEKILNFPRKPISINNKSNLDIFMIDWLECDEVRPYALMSKVQKEMLKWNRFHDKTYTIFGFGVTAEGYSVCLKIKNYHPYFFIKIPDNWDKKRISEFETNFLHRNELISEEQLLQEIADFEEENHYNWYPNTPEKKMNCPSFKSSIISTKTKIIKKEIFWTFMNHQKFKFWKVHFQSKNGFRLYHNYLKDKHIYPINSEENENTNGENTDNESIDNESIDSKSTDGETPIGEEMQFKLFESDLEPLLRFYHDSKIKPSDWISLSAKRYQVKPRGSFSHCQIDIEIDWNEIKPSQKTGIPPLIVASFDIEADSSHGDFPIAKKDCKKLANQLVICYLRDRHTMSKFEKTDQKYIDAKERLDKKGNFFKERILQALRHGKQVDEDISELYVKDRSKIPFTKKIKELEQICRDIFYICNRPIRKVKANNEMKAAIRTIEYRLEDLEEILKKKKKSTNINQLLSIIYKVSEEKGINVNDLKDKILVKDILVKFVNQLLNSYLPAVIGDSVIQIGTVFWRFGDDKPILNHMITLDGCSDFVSDDIPNEIISFDQKHNGKLKSSEEKKLLNEWTNTIIKYDPDIILGYNIFGFDEIFMYERALDLNPKATFNKSLSQSYKDFINMGRLTQKTCANIRECQGRLQDKKLASSALGANYLYYFNMPGRVQIDLLKVVQGGLTKLPSYKLDSVAEFYISGKVKNIGHPTLESNPETSRWIEVANIKELEMGNYLIITMKTGEQVEGGNKLVITQIDREHNLIQLKNPVHSKILKESPTWGIAKDDVSPKDIFRLQKGSNDDRAIVAKYCVQDCALVIRLLRKLDTIPNNFGMSNVCLVPFSFIFMRGQGIKIFSLMVNECSQNGFLLPVLEKKKQDKMNETHIDDIESEDEEELDLDNPTIIEADNKGQLDSKTISKFLNESILDNSHDDDSGSSNGTKKLKFDDDFNVIEMSDDGYEGAIVLVPIPGIYIDDPVTVLDFSSLYPSEMIASNLSHDSHCENEHWMGEEGAKRIHALGYDYKDVTYDIFTWVDPNNHNKGKHKVGETTERFVQYSNGKKGLLPQILQKLLGARKATKKKMKNEKDPFKASILDGLQLAYKVTANSLYGQTGASTSKVYKKAIAASTTAGGRRCIYMARDYVLKNNPGCEVTYGDSIPAWETVKIVVKDNFYKSRKFLDPNNKSFSELTLVSDTISNIKEKYFDFNNIDNNDSGKQHFLPKIEFQLFSCTDEGLTKIQNLMEHKSNNDIIKIFTTAGVIHVTQEHSIILENGKIITPNELKIEDYLLTHNNEYPYCNLKHMPNSYQNQRYIKRAKVLKIENLGPTDENVYDFTTENHKYQAGNGNIVVHNTDSVFIKLNLAYEDGTYPKTHVEKVQRSIDIGLALQQKLKDDKYFDPPHDLEYEKVFYPLMLITKKRYGGEKFEFEADQSKFTSMGIVLKRRDNAPILKYIYGGVMNKIMKDKDIEMAAQFVRDSCQALLDDKFDLNMFVISKTLRDYYKDPESIAHKVLADRMGERDPGNKPASNERIPYAYIQVEKKPGVDLLQGDKIEHINYIKENKETCKLDYLTYIQNQLLKPICQIFELVIEKMKGFPYHKTHFQELYMIYYDKYKGDEKKTDKKISELKQKVAAKIIFEKYLIQAFNKQNNINTLDNWLIKDEQFDVDAFIDNAIETEEVSIENNKNSQKFIGKKMKQQDIMKWIEEPSKQKKKKKKKKSVNCNQIGQAKKMKQKDITSFFKQS